MIGSVYRRPFVWKRISMPDGCDIVLTSKYLDGSYFSVYDENHNVYRIDRNGDVLWQVIRDDGNHDPGWWNRLMRHTGKGIGLVNERAPFTYLWLTYADGTHNVDPHTGSPPDIQDWISGAVITLAGSAYQAYILDPDTGVAKNVTKLPVRPW